MNKRKIFKYLKITLLIIFLVLWGIFVRWFMQNEKLMLVIFFPGINIIFFLSALHLRMKFIIYYIIGVFITFIVLGCNIFYLHGSLRVISVALLINISIYLSLIIYFYNKLQTEQRSNELSIEKLSEECNVLKLEYNDFIEKRKSLKLELERMQKLSQTAFILGTSIDEKVTTLYVVKETVDILDVKKVFFSKYNRGDGRFHVVSQHGYTNAKNKSTDNIDDWIKGSKIPILISNTTTETKIKVRRYSDFSSCNSVIAAPIIISDKVDSVLRAEFNKPDYFSNNDLRVLDYISDLSSVVFENLFYFKEIERLAITDGITGLYVHRYMLEKLKNEIQRYFRHKVCVSLIMMDIDDFKHFNDTYGHPFGDQVLITVSRIIKQAIREIDFPVRYGGDEFAIILPQTDLKGAKILAERLLKKFNSIDLNLLFLGEEIKAKECLRVSLGVGAFKKSYKVYDKFIDKIDQALYKAKQLGKNRIEVVK